MLISRASAVRFLHTADWQLGMTRHWLGEHQGVYDRARINAIRRIGRLAEEQRLRVHPGLRRRLRVRAGQAAYRASRCWSGPGSAHAGAGVPAARQPRSADRVGDLPLSTGSCGQAGEGVRVLDAARPGSRCGPGVELLAAPWFSQARPRPSRSTGSARATGPAAVRSRADRGRPRRRGLAGVGAPGPGRIPISTARLEAAGGRCQGRVDYVALGDRHSKLSVGRSDRIWYSGSPEPTATRDPDPGYVLVVEARAWPRHPRVAPHQVATLDLLGEEHFELTEAADADTVLAWLDAFPEKADTVAKPILDGVLGLADSERLERRSGEPEPPFRGDPRIGPQHAARPAGGHGPGRPGAHRLRRRGPSQAVLRDQGGEEANDALRLLIRLAGN